MRTGKRGAHVLWIHAFIAFLIVLEGAAARAVPLEATKGKVEFLAIGRPSAIKINGKGSGPAGEVALKKSGESYLLNAQVQVDLESLETGIGMRDRHMKEKYLETEQHKSAVLVMKDVVIPASVYETGGEVAVQSRLTLRGQERQIPVILKLANKGENIVGRSMFKLKLTDYGIEIPHFAGVTVADEVEITAETRVSKAALAADQEEK